MTIKPPQKKMHIPTTAIHALGRSLLNLWLEPNAPRELVTSAGGQIRSPWRAGAGRREQFQVFDRPISADS